MPPQLKRKNEPIDSPINSQKKAKIIQDEENSEQEDDAPPHVPDPIDIEFTEEHISQSGTIEQMELINFMCHAHLKVDFGPKINFVIGHNGSGKSAILTALTVVLGASANTTQRGKSLNALIKEGSR
ncbi:hypothetical protein BDB01DRAFT_383344 [Pilobolus umbonatus]|nr:hypothetical protein BDB01DRAFT_383344 [Pilobolus umbonatus]